MTDHFASDGATWPWYAAATYPPAFHDPVGGKTWLVREAMADGGRRVRAITWDAQSSAYGDSFDVGINPLQNDDHGVPAAVMDHQGHVHVFYGAHDSSIRTASTVAPRDPSQWADRAALSGNYTYPHPTTPIAGMIHLFLRKQIASGIRRVLVLRKTTSLADGVATFGPETIVVDFGTNSRVYAGNIIEVGADLHFLAVMADYADNFRRNVYYFIYDAATDSVRNVDGTVVVASGSLPVTLASANADFRIVAQTSNVTEIPGFCIDGAGAPHIAYMDGASAPFDVKYITRQSGAWTAPETIGILPERFSEMALLARDDGSIEHYFIEDDAAAWPRGGNIRRRTRDAGGIWGPDELVRSAAVYALDRPSAVRNGVAAGSVIYCETKGVSNDSVAGGLKSYLFGADGIVARADPPAVTTLLIDGTGAGAGSDPHFADVNLLIDLAE